MNILEIIGIIAIAFVVLIGSFISATNLAQKVYTDKIEQLEIQIKNCVIKK